MMSAPSAVRDRSRRRRFLRRAVLMALHLVVWGVLASLLVVVFFGSRTIHSLDENRRFARGSLGSALKKEHGVLFYADMDGRRPVDYVSGKNLAGFGSQSVSGVFGKARRFEAGSGAYFVSRLRWTALAGNAGSVALFVRVESGGDPSRECRIFWDRDPASAFGLRVRDGRLEAVYTDAEGPHALSAPFSSWDRFESVALVLGPERVSLWVGGREADARPVAGSLRFPPHPLSFKAGAASFSIDEACVWNRPLSPEEVAAIARSGRTIGRLLEPRRTRRIARQEALLDVVCGLCRTLDRLVPSRRGAATMRGDLPTLDLRLSARDERWFHAAHARARADGCRSLSVSDSRKIRATFGGRTEAVRATLLDLYDVESDPDRCGFILWGSPGFLAPGPGAVRLVPPELWGDLHPEAPRPLPLAPGSLVRFTEDGDFRGLFVMEPFDAVGGAWRATGQRNRRRSDFLFFSDPAPFAFSGGARTKEELDDRYRDVLSDLRSDVRFPWSASEAVWRANRHAERRAIYRFAAPALAAIDLCGANPSPLALVGDLDLTAAGPGVRWRSSDPATVSPDGRVTRPEGNLPAVAELSGVFPDGSERAFRFRVLPRAPRLPSFFLHFGEPLEKDFKRDFSGLLLRAGETGEEVRLVGTGDHGGGAHHRGNTSYVRGSKRSVSLEFDAALDRKDGAPPSEHLLLLCGYADPTRLRNRLCYDLFNAMPREGGPLAVPVSWAEVSFNGAWAGVWETAPRPQDVFGAAFSDLYKVRSSRGLWSEVSPEIVDRIGPPAPKETDGGEPFCALSEFVVRASDSDFAARAEEVFDLDELADFWLLLNFSGNGDGRVTNQLIGRRASDGRWVLLPWDYDKTFLAPPGRAAQLSNPIFDRLFRLCPGFREKLRARWADLRAGPFSDEALLSRIDADASLLSPLMGEEWRLLKPVGFDGDYDSAVRVLREEALVRASLVDSFVR